MKFPFHLCIGLVMLVPNFQPGFAQETTFVISSSPGVGNKPISSCAADVNGDGKVDLICVNYGDQTITVLTNNGIGGFGLSSSPAVGSKPQCVVAADVNGDGNVDLISANYGDNTLTVLTNDGSGMFFPASTSSVSNPGFVVAADVNGDGKTDLISADYGANFSKSALTVLTNDGGGGFVFCSLVGVGIHPVSVCAADVNGDGNVDLICANYGGFSDDFNSTLTILTNDGTGNFRLSSSPVVGIYPDSVCAADVNGDGKVDLICANYGDNTLTVLTNDGMGGFMFASATAVGSGPVFVCAADVNEDGKVDLICANEYDSTLTVLTNNGTGGFTISSSPAVGLYPVSVCAADMNGDGKLDLISANWGNGTLTVLTNAAWVAPVVTPVLTIMYASKQIIISWPQSIAGWILQTNTSITAGPWGNYSGNIVTNSILTIPTTKSLFFRLTHQ
jgi:hypothetical protein